MNIICALSESDKAINQVFNCAVGEQTSLNSLYKMIGERLIEQMHGLEMRTPIYRDFRSGDVRHSLANISKAKELIGYEPSHRIAEGLDEVIGWYIKSITAG